MERKTSRCKYCESENQTSFGGEIALHFRGLVGLNKPILWVFPDVSVCLNCGTAVFGVPDREMQVLRDGKPQHEIGSTARQDGGR